MYWEGKYIKRFLSIHQIVIIMKPRIFIGSSQEGLPVAEEVKSYFKNDYDCFLWTDEIFKYNENFLETLMKEASLFDYGFMIFTKDDYTKSRKEKFKSPRDNVVFEFGLFLGRLGKDNAFVIMDKDVKLPTDLLGTSIVDFTSKKIKRNLFNRRKNKYVIDEKSLINKLDSLKRQIEEKASLGVLGMLPSTVLAIGYFENFVQPICEFLSTVNSLMIREKEYNQFKFKLILPSNLDSDIKKKANSYYKEANFETIEIPTSVRNYPLYVMVDTSNKIALLSDMPTTLRSMDIAIEMYMRKGHVGKSIEQTLLEDRELRNFGMVLQNLIKSDIYCENLVIIESEKLLEV